MVQKSQREYDAETLLVLMGNDDSTRAYWRTMHLHEVI